MSLILDKVTYIYQQTSRGIRNISLGIPQGEWSGLVGRSGSGKSTLLRVIAGLLPPQSGSVSYPAHRGGKPVSLVLQFPEHHFFSTTVRDELAFALKGSGLRREAVDAEIRSALSAVGIDSDVVAQLSPFQLSGSQQRLVAIAAALIQKPAVLLLDEPGAGLDPNRRLAMFEHLDAWRQKTGSGILLSTHDMDEVARWAKKVVVINSGEIVAHGNIEDGLSFSWADNSSLGVPSATSLLVALQELGCEVPQFARTPEEAARLVLDLFNATKKGER